MPGALEGIRILEWAEWGQVPMATSILGDMGAEVIKIEHPTRGDGARGHVQFWGVSTKFPNGGSLWYEICNRNKRGITLNLADPRGRDIAYRLAKSCDVFATCYNVELAKRLGMDYESLRQHNPGIISAAGSTFGRKGPHGGRPGFDWAGLGRAGLYHRVMGPDMTYTNLVDGLADQCGAIVLALGILGAVVSRQKTGQGQEVEGSLLGSIINLQRLLSLEFTLLTGSEPPKLQRKKTKSPLQNLYKCKDDKWLALMLMQSDRFWVDLCAVLGLESLANDPRFADRHARSANAEVLTKVLDDTFGTRTYSEWEAALSKTDILFTPIQSLSEVGNDPQALANQYIIEYDHPTMGKLKSGGFPLWFSETPCEVKLPAPEFGQHTEEVLTELGGYSWEEVSQFRDQGIL